MNILSLQGVRSASLSPIEKKNIGPEPPFAGTKYRIQRLTIAMDDGRDFIVEMFMRDEETTNGHHNLP